MPACTKIFSFESTLGPKTPSKRLKIAIFGGDAKSNPKIATFKVAIATTFASPSRFQNRHFGDLSPRLATLVPNVFGLIFYVVITRKRGVRRKRYIVCSKHLVVDT